MSVVGSQAASQAPGASSLYSLTRASQSVRQSKGQGLAKLGAAVFPAHDLTY